MTVISIGSPIGELWLGEDAGKVCLVSAKRPAAAEEGSTPLLERTAAQLAEFFAGKRRVFELPIRIAAAGFAGRVYEEMAKIPYGQTISYKQLAAAAGSPAACRAVGNICAANPIVILIPCHRVVRSDGGPGGFALGIEHKIWLTEHEAKNVR